MKRRHFLCLIALLLIAGTFVTVAGAERVIIGFRGDPDQTMLRHGTGMHLHHGISAVSVDMPVYAIERIARDPRIAYIEPDYQVHALGDTVPWGIERVGAPTVHEAVDGDGVRVAVLDTGIDYTHPDLEGNYRGGYDFVNDDADPMDDNGHGTHCAGIIAAERDESGIIGVAPKADLYAVKVLSSGGGGYISDVVSGIEWAIENDIQIISMSLGSNSDSYALRSACDAAYEAGIVLVGAAGNDGRYSGYGDTVDYPARYGSVIAVSAIDENNQRASWSSTGPAVELAAPGVGIYSTYPDGYRSVSGTSMACPHVAGVAALVLAAHPDLGNTEVRELLTTTATDLGRSAWYGYGLVNAAGAVGDVVVTDTTPPGITGVTVKEITGTGAVITWQTDEPASGTLRYGTSPSALNDQVSETASGVSHRITLANLEKGVTYSYTVSSTDAYGNTATDPAGEIPYTFTTLTNDLPVADAGADKSAGDADGDGLEAVLLDGSGSSDPDGSIVAYEWLEGDATLGTGEQITYAFAVGTHTVTLRVTDTDGAAATDSVQVVVKANQPPVAVLSGDGTAHVDSPAAFDAAGSYDPDGMIVQCDWEFGDGTSGTGTAATHIYDSAGTYAVTLTVTDNGGRSSTETQAVTVIGVNEAPGMHVWDIDMLVEENSYRTYCIATVTIVDDGNNPVPGAEVTGYWGGLGRGTGFGTTDSAGSVTFTSNAVRRNGGLFIFTVDLVEKEGRTYTPALNLETFDSVSA
ncbi:S8 family serine peptidase [Methanoculleus taiwanensis]|uniref:S8 family serine peptidase n=1 Tax=Methanoculleus taiwanensis TaxID=1550565 RepID=UPI000FFE3BBA|nr:S8 family serine peptidase [Methanoculleus taiwanensis]